jgi:sugar-specific transcriptional regulator TrmB
MDRVVDVLKQCIADFEVRIKNNDGDAMKLHEKLLKQLEKKMQDLEAKELAQWEAQSHPDPAQRMPPHIFTMLNEKLLKEKDEVKEAMCNARKSMPNPINYEEEIERFREALDALLNPNVDVQRKNRLLKACIDRIDYYREAPQRITKPNKQRGKRVTIDGKRVYVPIPDPQTERWTSPPIEIDVKLKV